VTEPLKKRSFFKQLLIPVSSLRLTVVLLGLSMILIFVGTILQVKYGLYEAQERYFRSWIAWLDVAPYSKDFEHIKIPFPGGMLLGSLLLLNLIAAHARRLQLRWNKGGLILVHLGIILMLLGELFTALLSEESQMRLDEGQTSNYSSSAREVELAVIQVKPDGTESVTVIAEANLKNGEVFEMDRFKIRVVGHFQNSTLEMIGAAGSDFDPMRADRGIGAGVAVKGKPPETEMDRRDITSTFVEIVNSTDATLGRWLLSRGLPNDEVFEIDGTTYKMLIRDRRFYYPFSIKLLDFTHERYLGTQIPKDFSSRIRLINPETGENRETLIYMNHPLRYSGLTFYQAGFDNNDETSILQVVRNPAWTIPYISCAMVSLGLLWIFGQHLIKALTRLNKKAV
jgi:hypothetical protein